MENSSMSRTPFRYRPIDCGLGPVCGFEVEDYKVGEVGSMLVFPAENQKFVALVESSGMT